LLQAQWVRILARSVESGAGGWTRSVPNNAAMSIDQLGDHCKVRTSFFVATLQSHSKPASDAKWTCNVVLTVLSARQRGAKQPAKLFTTPTPPRSASSATSNCDLTYRRGVRRPSLLPERRSPKKKIEQLDDLVSRATAAQEKDEPEVVSSLLLKALKLAPVRRQRFSTTALICLFDAKVLTLLRIATGEQRTR
jgi:hypothetical protein